MEMRPDKENLALVAALVILVSAFSFSLYHYFRPQQMVWEVKVFEYVPQSGHTYVAGYGGGYLRLMGRYDLEVNVTYRITYTTTRQNWAEKIISIEKIEG